MKKTLLITLTLLLAACESPVLNSGDDTGNTTTADANVILRVAQLEQIPFTRDPQDITTLCTRLSIALFQNGAKVRNIAQKESDSDFGTVALSIARGTYQLVVIAHSGDGTATITSEEKVTFPNNKVTDTFYYYGDIVATDTQQNYDLTLSRAVSMFRLELTDDEIPAQVAKMKFFYLGGSSTFSPKSGYGCVNSRQTELRSTTGTPDAATGGSMTFDIYTLPHTEEDMLTKLTVTALDENDNIVTERTFENIPVTRNQITRYTCTFFGGGTGPNSDNTLHLSADPEWDGVKDYAF